MNIGDFLLIATGFSLAAGAIVVTRPAPLRNCRSGLEHDAGGIVERELRIDPAFAVANEKEPLNAPARVPAVLGDPISCVVADDADGVIAAEVAGHLAVHPALIGKEVAVDGPRQT